MRIKRLGEIILVGVAAVVFFATVSKGASFGPKTDNRNQKTEKSKTIELTGVLENVSEGKHDLNVEILDNDELLFSKEFKGVEINDGFYALTINLKEAGLEVGRTYGLRITVLGEEGIVTEAVLDIVPSLTIQAREEDGPTILGQYTINGTFPAPGYVVKVTNLANGIGVQTQSNGGTALLAETRGTGIAVEARSQDEGGQAILARGDVSVEGNTAISGDLSVDGEVNFSPATNIDADTLDGKDSTEFIPANGDAAIQGNLSVNGTGTNSFAGNIDLSGAGATLFTNWISGRPGTKLELQAGSATRMIVTQDGNVGIGTTSPVRPLTVRPSSDVNFGVGNNGGAVYVTAHNDANSVNVPLQVESSVLWINPNSGGKVGIGTINPSAELEISASAQESAVHIDADSNQQSALYFYKGGLSKTALYRPADSDDLRIWGSANQSDLVTFKNDGSGNVGIGTSDPSQKLDVNGNILSSGEIVGKEMAGVRIATQYSSIQEAINSLPAEGGEVYLPAGTYNVTSTISVPSNVTLRGAGRSTILKATGAFSVITNASYPATNEGIVLRDFKIDGSGVSLHGIILSKPYKCYLENIIVEDSQKGVEITNNQDSGVFATYTTLESVKVFNSRDKGIPLSNVSHVAFSNCMAVNGGKEGFHGAGARFITLTNCHAYGNAESGFKPSYGTLHWTFNSCISRDNAWSGFDISEAVEAFHTFNGCIAENNRDRAGFRVTSAKVTFNGCIARNNQDGGLYLDDQYRDVYDITVSGGIFESNNNAGIRIDADDPYDRYGISGITITGVRATKNQSYGIIASGNFDYILVTGNDFHGNPDDINIPDVTNRIVTNNFGN